MINNLRKWIKANNVILILVATYLALSIIRIEHPGVNNDQLMFVNAATFNPDNFFSWKSFHGVTTLVFPYIGALKSYLYIPIFYIFGVNIWSIRLPQILIIALAWIFLYKALNMAFNKKLALLAILFLCLDPSIIAYSRIDTGPTVIEFFLKTITIFLLYLYIKNKKLVFFFLIYPVLALGVFNKINFIWFINAFLASFILFYFKRFYTDLKGFGKLIPFLAIGIPYYFLFRIFSRLFRETAISYKMSLAVISPQNIYDNLFILTKNFIGLLSGDILFQNIYGFPPTSVGIYSFFLVIVIIFIGLTLVFLKKNPPSYQDKKSYYFILSITLLTVVQILLTKQAISPWHIMITYPFITIIFASSILQIIDFIKWPKIKTMFWGLITLMVCYLLIVNFIYITKYSSPTKSVAYSSAIYDVIDFVKSSKAKFICFDVDICNQLLSFNQQTNKYKEPFSFIDADTYTYSFIKLSNNFKTPNEFLYIGHSETNSHFPEFRKSFFRYLNGSGVKYQKIKEFNDGEEVAFEVYKIGNY